MSISQVFSGFKAVDTQRDLEVMIICQFQLGEIITPLNSILNHHFEIDKLGNPVSGSKDIRDLLEFELIKIWKIKTNNFLMNQCVL